MKKFLEVLIDDNNQMYIDTDIDLAPILSSQNIPEYDKLAKESMKAFSECIWKDRNLKPSYVVRLLSMAEIASTSEPYSMAEEFWSTMMFCYIPHYEAFCNKLKTPFGFDPKKVTRPISFGKPGDFLSCSMFPVGGKFS